MSDNLRKKINRLFRKIGIPDSIFLRKIKNFYWIIQNERKIANQTLYSFYDLDIQTPTFDITWFLIQSENERIRLGLSNIAIVFVPGKRAGVSHEYFDYLKNESIDNALMFENFNWRLNQILIPCCSLLPTCKQIIVCNTRYSALKIQKKVARNIFPKKYSVLYPVNLWKNAYKNVYIGDRALQPSFVPSELAIAYTKIWLSQFGDDKKFISITLRETQYETKRNSNVDEWKKFILSLDENKYHIIIVRDTESAFLEKNIPELSHISYFELGPWNIQLRAALYDQCYLNFFSSGGPFTIALFNKKSRVLFFKILNNELKNANKEFFEHVGIPLGENPPFLSDFQKFVWKEDTFENIWEEFDEMIKRIESYQETKTL